MQEEKIEVKGLNGRMDELSFNHSSSSFIDIEVLSIDECEERVRNLFDKALLVFLEEEGSYRTLPVILGDGEKVDLFRLFVLVREREGFDSVTRKGLWGLVTEKLGLDRLVSPSLRLIYFKYLNRMEKWAVKASRIVNWENQDCKKKGCYGGMLHELGEGFKGLLKNGSCQKRNRAMVVGCSYNEELSSEFHRSMKRSRESSHYGALEVSCVVLSDDFAVSTKVEGLDLYLKKKGDLSKMLKWLTLAARSPEDPSIGVIPHHSKWEKYSGKECWIQLIRARNALIVQRDYPEFRYQNFSYQDLQIHPSMYPSIYDDVPKSFARLRYGIRSPHLPKHCTSSCCSGIHLTGETSRTTTDLAAGTSGSRDLQVHSNAITQPDQSWIEIRYAQEGPEHQAQVDEWIGSGSASDTKWLGTLIWPLKNEEALDDLVGKGRPDSCSCAIPNAVECVRFHIAEKRMELKRELGSVFFQWRFNEMGEEVSLWWTRKEVKMFEEMMIADPSNFWKKTARCFKGKKKEQLVSYFFNVFLIHKRRYQNRVTPSRIDSDDEAPFGSVGRSFGRDAVTSFDTDIMICSQNRQE